MYVLAAVGRDEDAGDEPHANWAFTSGGEGRASAPGCVAAGDTYQGCNDVVFDENSGKGCDNPNTDCPLSEGCAAAIQASCGGPSQCNCAIPTDTPTPTPTS